MKLNFRPDDVAALMRQSAGEIALPYFRHLEPGDIIEKTGPRDLITPADPKSEKFEMRGLRKILRGSVVAGEEATGKGALPLVLKMSLEHPVWTIDPIDGTYDFAHGLPAWSKMISLYAKGEGVASWIYHPVADVMIAAEKGSGAFIGDRRLLIPDPADDKRLKGIVVLPHIKDGPKILLDRNRDLIADLSPWGNAGIQYTRLVTSFQPEAGHDVLPQCDFFLRKFGGSPLRPWDHAPGQIIATEAGLVSQTLDGKKFNLDEINDPRRDQTLLVAPARAWQRLQQRFAQESLFGLA